MLPDTTPSIPRRRNVTGIRYSTQCFRTSLLFFGGAAFLLIAAVFYGADAFFWLMRHSRFLRGSCLPHPASNPLYPAWKPPPSFAVLSFHHATNSGFRELSLQNHKAYCALHGYSYIDGQDWYIRRPVNQREKTWDKILFLRYAMSLTELKAADWLLWIDPDAVFANMDTRLDELLSGLDSDSGASVVLVAAPDALCINAGVLLVRNNDKGAAFVEDWLSTRNVTINDDQRGLNVLYNRKAREAGLDCTPGHFPYGTLAELSCHEIHIPEVLVLPPCAMNSGPGLEWKPGHGPYWSGVFMHGDFIMHVAGQGLKKPRLIQQQVRGEFFWSKRKFS